LMRSEAPPHAGAGGRVMQLFARGRGLPVPAGGRPVNNAQQGPGRELAADLHPWIKLIPRPAVHPDLAALAAFPAANQDRAASRVQVALLERERLADQQTCAP